MCGYDRVIVEPSGIFDVDEFLTPSMRNRWQLEKEIGNVIIVWMRSWQRSFLRKRIICWLPRWQMQAMYYWLWFRGKPRWKRSAAQRALQQKLHRSSAGAARTGRFSPETGMIRQTQTEKTSDCGCGRGITWRNHGRRWFGFCFWRTSGKKWGELQEICRKEIPVHSSGEMFFVKGFSEKKMDRLSWMLPASRSGIRRQSWTGDHDRYWGGNH